MAQPVRVMLVDDHAIVREGYRRLLELEPDMQVVSEHADADDACRALARSRPGEGADVVILDLSMPGRSGLEAMRDMRRVPDAPKVLVFTMHGAAGMVDQALRAGASGFVTKASEPEVLVRAVRRVAAGESPVLSADVPLSAPRAAEAPDAPAGLSPREFEVVQLLLAGCTTEQVGQRLGLSTKTAANYQTAIRQKLGVQTTIELQRVARERGWTMA
ncbi:MAG: response regulator transcription factor [Burkholderiaceae bacterium]